TRKSQALGFGQAQRQSGAVVKPELESGEGQMGISRDRGPRDKRESRERKRQQNTPAEGEIAPPEAVAKEGLEERAAGEEEHAEESGKERLVEHENLRLSLRKGGAQKGLAGARPA